MSLEVFIKEYVDLLGNRVDIAPNIPIKKINAAISSMTDGTINPEYIIAIVDTSLLGNGKNGCLFTGDCLYINALFRNKVTIPFETLESVERTTEMTVNDKGIEKEIEHFIVTLEHEEILDLSNDLNGINLSILEKIFLYIIQEKNKNISFETSNQGNMTKEDNISPLSDMETKFKDAYIKIIINGIIDAEIELEGNIYSEVISLMVRNRIDKDLRIELRDYLITGKQSKENTTLLSFLKEELSKIDFEVIKYSLLKDLLGILRTYYSSPEELVWKDYSVIVRLAETLEIEDSQVDEIEKSLIYNENILKHRQNDSQIKKTLQDIGARAAAVGIPLAALYFTGTAGVSAAGITSGLAALGLKGFLGLSPMMAGVGTLILLGVGTYSGLKKLTGISELENNKTREVMLLEIIKNSQASINILIEDINEITVRLTDAVNEGLEGKEKIAEISKVLNLLAKNTHALTQKLNKAERESVMLTLPLILDVSRLKELTSLPTERKYYEVVMQAYTEEIVAEEHESQDSSTGETEIITNETVKYRIKENLSLEQLESLNVIFDQIGYNRVSSASVASVKGKAKDLLSKFGGES